MRKKTFKSRFLLGLAICACTMAMGSAALAQVFPAKPVTLVVPFPPGAATDFIARAVAQQLSQKWQQAVIVDNRPGATGSIGSSYVANAAPDGYTLLVATTSSHTMGPHLFKKMTWDPVKDFMPITLLAWAPNVLEVNPNVPAKSVEELIALLKKNPGKYTFASSGTGSSIHLAGELFKSMAQVDMMHVPYKGAAPAVMDMLAGQVDIMFDTVALSLPHIKAGKLRPLAVTTSKRSASLPEVPTMQEAGLPGYEMAAWIGLLAPRNTPNTVVKKIGDDVRQILRTPEFKTKVLSQGADVAITSSEEFAARISKELPNYANIIKAAGIKPGD